MRQNDSSPLHRAFTELAQDMEGMAAPPRLEQQLVGAFQARQRARKQRQLAFALAIAASLVVVLAVAALRPRVAAVPIAVTPTPKPNPSPVRLSPASDPPAVAPPVTVATAVRRPVRRRTAPKPPAPKPLPAESFTEFLPVAGTETWGTPEQAAIYRVTLPRTALAAFGLPMNERRLSERVKADLLVGEDGLARAVRFVQ